MSKKKDIIRVGDKVKILRPAFIYRWGYDNNLQDVSEEVLEKYKPQMRKFLQEISDAEGFSTTIRPLYDLPMNFFNRMASSVAYFIVGKRMRNGAVRKLFYITDEDKGPMGWLNHDYPEGSIHGVAEVKTVKTGRYFGPSGGYDSGYDYNDWEPGGLSNEKTHKLLRVGYTNNWIEAINVEKVHEN